MLKESYKVLDQLRNPENVYVASVSNDYRYIWIRDCVYMSLPYVNKANSMYEKTYHRLFDMLLDYEWKIDILRQNKPTFEWEYIHARYSEDFKEIHSQNWGHIQHDMIGGLLFGIGLGIKYGKQMLRNEADRAMVQKLVQVLESVEYWHDPDNGMWEEWREVHSSSVGACVAGLKAVESIVYVPEDLVSKGLQTMFDLFPRESHDKPVDLAQLSLIYPYRLFTGLLGEQIVKNVENRLLRQRGVIRYEGDSYYNIREQEHGRAHNSDFYYGGEAEWTFGLPWLALCQLELGNPDKALEYVRRTESVMLSPGILPELYFSGSSKPNPNTPLGWSSAMYILAKEATQGINKQSISQF